ncbi:hypothetical protein [Aneurinibacillus thermoaerophilus]|uniref:hypothetical protein n=1 Tax=Aneurinibacillus thermoaerophilus TaxID=143495 RepID=UPI002E1B5190|nr:hypothetical protein [Aneurinibacillus thermoaerophilus]
MVGSISKVKSGLVIGGVSLKVNVKKLEPRVQLGQIAPKKLIIPLATAPLNTTSWLPLVILIGFPAWFNSLHVQAPPPPGQETVVDTDDEVVTPLIVVDAVNVTRVGGVPSSIINGAINTPLISVLTVVDINITTPEELLNVTVAPGIGTPLQVTVPLSTPPQTTVEGRDISVMDGVVQVIGGHGGHGGHGEGGHPNVITGFPLQLQMFLNNIPSFL